MTAAAGVRFCDVCGELVASRACEVCSRAACGLCPLPCRPGGGPCIANFRACCPSSVNVQHAGSCKLSTRRHMAPPAKLTAPDLDTDIGRARFKRRLFSPSNPNCFPRGGDS